ALTRMRLMSTGVSFDELKAAWEARRAVAEKRRSVMDKATRIFRLPIAVGGLIEAPLCRDVITRECQERVCVDQPAPITLDLGWEDVDGNFNWLRQYDRFGLSDSVYGDDYWNLSGHHRTGQTHDGQVGFRAGATLAADAHVRAVGVRF